MKTCAAVAAAVVVVVALIPQPSSAVTASSSTTCTPAQLQTLTSAAASAAGILAACERDTGFRLFPFAALPTSTEQQRHVCLGRSCPTAIASLRDAELPECLVTEYLTPVAFLDGICKISES